MRTKRGKTLWAFSVMLFLLGEHTLLSQEDRFMGSLPPSEKRIKDHQEAINGDSPNFPEEMHLYFQELAGDYAIFYDRDGRVAHFQYRKNKWDREAIESTHNLIPGRSYRIRGEFLGLLVFRLSVSGKKYPIPVFAPKGIELTIEDKKDRNSIPVYRLEQYQETYSSTISKF